MTAFFETIRRLCLGCRRPEASSENRRQSLAASRDKRERGDWEMRPGFGAKRVAVGAFQLIPKNSATTASHEFFVAARNFRAETACALPGRRAVVATRAIFANSPADFERHSVNLLEEASGMH